MNEERAAATNDTAGARPAVAWLAACVLPCIVGVLSAQQTEPQGAPPRAADASAGPQQPWLRGRLTSRQWVRWTGEDADTDLYALLSLDAGRTDDDVVGHLLGRLAWDLDGVDDTFAGIDAAHDGSPDLYLYDAWVDFRQWDSLALARLGRQSLPDTPEVAWFDGLHAASAERGDLALQVGGYIGASTHLYESSRSGDLLAGAYVQGRPWRGARLRLDCMHLEDEARLRSHEHDLLGAGYWQSLWPDVDLDVQYTRLGGRDRDASGRAAWCARDQGLLVQGSYYVLLQPQGDLVLEADPFFSALNELHPYSQWSALVAQDVTTWLQLQAALDLRRVRDRADVGFYNRDFDHYYATATLAEFGIDGLRLQATADCWDATAQIVRNWGADLTWDHDRNSASLGSYWSLYKFDLFSNSERDHVRTWYLRLRHAVSDAVTIEGDYELEDDDFDEYHRLRLGVVWRF